VTGRAPQAHERIGERAPLLSGDLSPEAGDPGGDVPAADARKQVPANPARGKAQGRIAVAAASGELRIADRS